MAKMAPLRVAHDSILCESSARSCIDWEHDWVKSMTWQGSAADVFLF